MDGGQDGGASKEVLKTDILKLLRFRYRFGVKSIFFPFYITRCFEYPAAFNRMELKKGLKVLDFGCGSSFFPVYLASCGIETYGLDVVGSSALDFKQYAMSRLNVELRPMLSYAVYEGDVLPYEADVFDRVFAISTLEHLRGEKDIKIVSQFKKTLKPKGKLFVSVEFRNDYKEIIPPTHNAGADRNAAFSDFVDFVRYYDEKALYERIIEPSGLKLKESVYFGAGRLNVRKFADRCRCLQILNPLLAGLFYRKLNGRIDIEKCAQAYPSYFSNIVACLVLEKT